MSSRSQGPIAPGTTLALNTLWNLAGMSLPALAALVAIPALIHQLGEDRFGVLTLAWVLSTLFALADLGLARATTNLLASEWKKDAPGLLSSIFWGSLTAVAAFAVITGAAFALLTPWIVDTILRPPAELRAESVVGLRLLAISIPFVLASGPVRSILEATQHFGRLNAVRFPLAVSNYLGPLLVTFVTPRLDLAIAMVVLTRILGFVAFSAQAYRVAPDLLVPVRPSRAITRRLLRVGAWFAVTGITLPAIAALDRLVIAARLSLADVGYYAAPYEVVTRLWFLSGSLLMVMFPVFSALEDPIELRRAYWRAIRHLFVPTAAIAALLIAFSSELLTMWLGEEFAAASAPVARGLLTGMLASVTGQVPFTFLMSVGRRAVVGIAQLVTLPLYAAVAWILAGRWGIVGVAAAWSSRALIEAVVLFVVAGVGSARLADMEDQRARIAPMALAGIALIVGAHLVGMLGDGRWHVKLLFMITLDAAFLAWAWRTLLEPSERAAAGRISWLLMRRLRER